MISNDAGADELAKIDFDWHSDDQKILEKLDQTASEVIDLRLRITNMERMILLNEVQKRDDHADRT